MTCEASAASPPKVATVLLPLSKAAIFAAPFVVAFLHRVPVGVGRSADRSGRSIATRTGILDRMYLSRYTVSRRVQRGGA